MVSGRCQCFELVSGRVNVFLFRIVADVIYQMYLSISVFLLTSLKIVAGVYRSSVPGRDTPQKTNLAYFTSEYK